MSFQIFFLYFGPVALYMLNKLFEFKKKKKKLGKEFGLVHIEGFC